MYHYNYNIKFHVLGLFYFPPDVNFNFRSTPVRNCLNLLEIFSQTSNLYRNLINSSHFSSTCLNMMDYDDFNCHDRIRPSIVNIQISRG